MAQTQRDPKTKTAPKRSEHSGQFVYALKDGRKGIKLPPGASWAIIPGNSRVAKQLKGIAPDRIQAVGRVYPTKEAAIAASRALARGELVAVVDPDDFAPDARARAILRGLEYARADLRDAGGAFDMQQVRELMHGISRQAVDKKIQEGDLLAVPGPSNRRRFPTIQFNPDGSLVPGLKEVQAALGYASPWSVLNFLVNPHDSLGGERPIDLLRKGALDRVLDAAGRIGVQGA